MTVAAIIYAPATARDKGQRAPVLEAVVHCRSIVDNAARLACFDTNVATFDTAEAKNDVLVVDKQEASDTRRRLFGLALPALPMFRRDGKDEEVTNVEYKLLSARRDSYGKYTFVLDDSGGTWRQIDSTLLYKTPKAGAPVKITKGVVGNYFMNVDGMGGIRVHRDG